MLEKFSFYNKSEMRQWDDFVKSHPKGSPFHLLSWIRTIQETYSFEPLLYVYKNGNGNISSVFPFFLIRSLFTGTRIVSLPFSDYCGPLCNDQDEETELLGKITEEHKDQVRYIEIRSVLSDSCGFVCHNYYKRHVLELFPDLSQLMKKIEKRTLRYSIKKAQKSGVEIREGNTLRDLDEFYRLNRLTRKKHGVPSQPLKYFKYLFEYMISKGTASILLAIWDSRVIAATLFLKFKETIYYKYSVSDPEYLSLKTPNHLLTWHAIQQASSEGYRFFDFCRTSPDNRGLMRYKEMWGAIPSDLPYYYYPKVKGTTSMEGGGLPYRILTKAWRSLPDAIVEIIGPKIYKHMA